MEDFFQARPFEEVKITTIVHIGRIADNVDYKLLFHAVPLIHEFTARTDISSKCRKFPCSTNSGDIIHASFENQWRGLPSKKDAFKHCMQMAISCSNKNISVKVSENRVHYSGSQRHDDAIEASGYIQDILVRTKRYIELMKSNPKIVSMALELLKGKETKRYILSKLFTLETDDYFVNQNPDVDYSGLTEEESDLLRYLLNFRFDPRKIQIIVIDKVVDKETGEPLIDEKTREEVATKSIVDRYIQQSPYYTDIEEKFKYLVRSGELYTDLPELQEPVQTMVNYSYNLGFSINRSVLSELLNDCDGFIGRFGSGLTDSASIELPYIPSVEQESRNTKRRTVWRHTFTCFAKGSITQSSPNETMARYAYNLFMKHIALNHRMIRHVD